MHEIIERGNSLQGISHSFYYAYYSLPIYRKMNAKVSLDTVYMPMSVVKPKICILNRTPSLLGDKNDEGRGSRHKGKYNKI